VHWGWSCYLCVPGQAVNRLPVKYNTPVTWDDAVSVWSVTGVEPSACTVLHSHLRVQRQSEPLTAMPHWREAEAFQSEMLPCQMSTGTQSAFIHMGCQWQHSVYSRYCRHVEGTLCCSNVSYKNSMTIWSCNMMFVKAQSTNAATDTQLWYYMDVFHNNTSRFAAYFLWPINIKWQNGWNSRTFCSCKSEEGIQQNLQND